MAGRPPCHIQFFYILHASQSAGATDKPLLYLPRNIRIKKPLMESPMRFFYTLFTSALMVSPLCAQQVSQEVISGGGGEARLHEIQFDWTLGEIAVDSYMEGHTMFTEGFHQPMLLVEELPLPEIQSSDNVNPAAYSTPFVSVMPNPTQGRVTIRFDQPCIEHSRIFLYQSEGREVARFDIPLMQNQYEFDMSVFPAGVYLLRFIHSGQASPSIFRITKTQ